MMSLSAPARACLAASLLLVAACNEENVSGLHPLIGLDTTLAVDVTGAADRVIDFGNVVIGTSGTRILKVNNLGRATLTLDAVAVTSPFEAEKPGPHEIAPEGKVELTVYFMPMTDGVAEQIVELKSDGGDAKIKLVGRGVERGSCLATVTPSVLSFGVSPVDVTSRRTVTITNPGDEECKVSSAALSTDTASEFTLGAAPAGGTSVMKGAPVEIEVFFKPTAEKLSTGKLVIGLGTGGTHTVNLSGEGLDIAPAEEPAYINTGKELYRFDPANETARKLAAFRPTALDSGMLDIGIDASGVMYGVTGKKLWIIDPVTAECSALADLDPQLEKVQGLTVLGDGRLVVAGLQLAVIDRTTAQITETFVPKSAGHESAGDVIALPDGFLYWTVRNGTAGDKLLRVDPNTGAVKQLSVLQDADGPFRGVYGLAYAADTLYGFTSEDYMIVIDPDDGRVIDVKEEMGGKWFGATSNPAEW